MNINIYLIYFILYIIYKNIAQIIYIYVMGIGDWGLGIGDWGLGIGDWAQSPDRKSVV